MSRFTFICEEQPSILGDAIVAKRTVEFDAVHLEGIIGEFETFLKGCGFYINGNLQIVDEPLGEKYPKDGPYGAGTNTIFGGAGNKYSQEHMDLYTESLFGKK